MDDWRRSTWATSGMVVFVGLIGVGTTWATANPPRSWWPLLFFFGFAALGLAIFVVAMARPDWLPGRTAAEREAEDRVRREIETEGRKEDARRMRGFFSPSRTDWDRRAHTDAMNRLADEMQRQREGGGGVAE